jgi:hypothetical protein
MQRPYQAGFPLRAALAGSVRTNQARWLLVDGTTLITPFPAREGGPTPDETAAILAMQRRLALSPVAVWINPRDGRLTPATIETDLLRARASANTTVRLRRRDVVAA